MSSRPKIHIEESNTLKRNHRIAFFLVIANFLMVLACYQLLPENITTHFNFLGQIDGRGPKSFIWLLPILSLATFALLRSTAQNPHLHNYKVKITKENASSQYQRSMEIGAYSNLLTISLLFLVTVVVMLSSFHSMKYYGTILIVAVVLYVVLMVRSLFTTKSN